MAGAREWPCQPWLAQCGPATSTQSFYAAGGWQRRGQHLRRQGGLRPSSPACHRLPPAGCAAQLLSVNNNRTAVLLQFKDEPAALKLKHDAAGVVGFANSGLCSSLGEGGRAQCFRRAFFVRIRPHHGHADSYLLLLVLDAQARTATPLSFTSPLGQRRNATASMWLLGGWWRGWTCSSR